MENRIAFISEHASPLALLGGVDNGGQNVYVAELAVKLAEKGYEVDIFTRRDDEQSPSINEFAPGVRVILVKAGPAKPVAKEQLLPYMGEFLAEMEGFMESQRIKYHLVHANFWMSGLVAMQLKEKYQIPFVITFHALGHVRKLHQKENDRFPPERVTIEKEIVQQANRIIAECPQDEADLIQYYQADQNKISIIPCGFNPDDFYPICKSVAKALLDFPNDERIILQLGRMVPRKGIDNVISAFAKLDRQLNAKLVVVGGESVPESGVEDPELERLRALANHYQVADRVVFAGRKSREMLRYYYSAADVFVTTPWYEPFGITPLEAMACGTPVIGANVGGVKYTVKDGETGFLVAPTDPDHLAEKMALLLADQDYLAKMRINALAHVQANFTWEKVAEQMSMCYEGIFHKLLSSDEDVSMIKKAFREAIETIHQTADVLSTEISVVGELLSKTLAAGKKILVCGNGGSAAESQHMVAELVGRFEVPNREGLPALALTADSAILTAWANDFGFDDVFARQVEAFGASGDVLICLSTSGNSKNLLAAMKKAHQKNMYCVNLLGKDGGAAVNYGHINLVIPSNSTQRIQEMHLQLVHLICNIVENRLFNNVPKEKTSVRSLHVPILGREQLPVDTYNRLKTNYGS
jgi:D-inositol-3-phosphate glycosyltransferase